MEEGSDRARRKVRKARVELRIHRDLQRQIKLKADKHVTSINNMFNAMVVYCLASEDFNHHLEEKFPRDLTEGFYTYHPGKGDPIPPHMYRR